MAIYHFTVKLITRSKGQSAVGSAAYRRATRLYDDRLAKAHDFTDKEDVIYSEIMANKNAPLWIKKIIQLQQKHPSKAAEILWNTVEKYDKRKDSQVAREVEFALPIELNQEQNITLVREFIHDQFVLRGMVADWSIHWDKGNPHVHVMLTLRELTNNGFGKKQTAWNAKNLLAEWRQHWAHYVNFHLRLNHHHVRVDHRSYKDQGIDLVPTIHRGKAVTDMEKRGLKTHIQAQANAICQENLHRIAEKPAILLKKITRGQEAFTHTTLTQELGRYITDKGGFVCFESESHNTATTNSSSSKAVIRNDLLKKMEQEDEDEEGSSGHAGFTLSPATILAILEKIEKKDSVFTERALAKAIAPYTDNAKTFAKALLQLKTSDQLILLGPGEDGAERFTTREMFQLENALQDFADYLKVRYQHRVDTSFTEQVILKYGLSREQASAIRHLVQDADITALVGRAGTGKSYALGAAKTIWEGSGYHVYGIALSSVAAESLASGSGIPSQTIDSFLHALKTGHLKLNKRSIVVMDEAGMTDVYHMEALVKAISLAGAKLVLAGDPAQVQPIGPGAPFRALLERIHAVELSEIRRQTEGWQIQATTYFAAGQTDKALDIYDQKGTIHFHADEEITMGQLIQEWLACVKADSIPSAILLAIRNDHVQQLNQLARQALIEAGLLKQAKGVIHTLHGDLAISVGERLHFLKNNRALGISNGHFATVEKIGLDRHGHIIALEVRLDSQPNKTIVFNPNDYQHITYGYAGTVHKFQGQTKLHTFTYVDEGGWNRNTMYVAKTRHRRTSQLYVNQKAYANLDALKKAMKHDPIKDSVLDFPWAFRLRRGLPVTKLWITEYQHRLATYLRQLQRQLVDRFEQRFNAERYWSRKAEQVQQLANEQAKQKRYQEAVLVHQYVETNRAVGRHWGELLHEREYFEQAGIALPMNKLRNTETYREAHRVLALRDTLAHQIADNIESYSRALERCGITLEKIQEHAQKHTDRALIKAYKQARLQDRIVYRDKLAASIISDTKRYAVGVAYLGEDWKLLREHAIAHERRLLLKQLSPQEREAFYQVEAYIKTYWSAARLWRMYFDAKQKDENIDPTIVAMARDASHKRNQLAGLIFSDLATYRIGLDFYHIERDPDVQNSYVSLSKHKEVKAKDVFNHRYIKLNKYAQQYFAQERVNLYLQRNFASHQREEAAHKIDLYWRLHRRYLLKVLEAELGEDKANQMAALKSLRQQIRQDAIVYRHRQLQATLSPTELEHLMVVDRFIDGRQQARQAWSTYYQEKARSAANKTYLNDLIEQAKAWSKQRDEAAQTIVANPSRYHMGLQLYRLKEDAFDSSIKAKMIHDRIYQFKSRTGALWDRIRLAQQIAAAPKAHHAELLEQGIDWLLVQRYARVGQRRDQLQSLPQELHQDYQFVDRYLSLVQSIRAYWAQQKNNDNYKNLSFIANKHNAIQLQLAERNYRAACILEEVERYRPVWPHSEMQERTLVKHAQAYYLRLGQIDHHLKQRQSLIDKLQSIFAKWPGKPSEKRTIDLQNYITWRHDFRSLINLANRFHKQPAYHFALKENDLTTAALNEDQKLLERFDHIVSHITQTPIDTLRSAVVNATSMPPAVEDKLLPLRKTKILSNVDDIRDALLAQAESVAHAVVNPERVFNTRQSNASQLVWGRKHGSLRLTLTGSRAGWWYDFENGQGGRDLISFIQYETGMNFKEALAWSQHFLKLDNAQAITSLNHRPLKKIPAHYKAANDAKAQRKRQERFDYACYLVNTSQSIEGTLAEDYLRKHRGIQGAIPACYRYHPSAKHYLTGTYHPALMAISKNLHGDIRGIQTIFLDENTANKAQLDPVKQSLGYIQESLVWLNHIEGAPVALVEGPETAQSVYEAKGHEWSVACTLSGSNFASAKLPESVKDVVIVADNDGKAASANKKVTHAIETHSAQGRHVWLVKPDVEGWDMNDVHVKQGINALTALLEQKELVGKAFDLRAEVSALQSIHLQPEKATTLPIWEQLVEGQNATGYENFETAVGAMVQDWYAHYSSNDTTAVLLAATPQQVQLLNDAARYLRCQQEGLTTTYSIKTSNGLRDLAISDRICFMEDYDEQAIKAGTLGILQKINRRGMTVQLDDGRIVNFRLSDYKTIDYGYAVLADRIKQTSATQYFVLAAQMDLKAADLSFLTHAQAFNFYWDKSEINNLANLKQTFMQAKAVQLNTPLSDKSLKSKKPSVPRNALKPE